MKYFTYLKYLLKHKYFVFIECFKLGIPLQGITHDISKFLPGEFLAYANHFYGTGQVFSSYYCKKDDMGDATFNRACNYHYLRNKHHAEYWAGQEMPQKYVNEMIADWIGSSLAQGKGRRIIKWYRLNKDKIPLHPETRKELEYSIGYKRR